LLSERLGFLQKEKDIFARREDSQEPAQSYPFEAGFRPDPLAARTPSEFIEALRRYRVWAGEPSFHSMAARSGRSVSEATMHAALNRAVLPRLAIVDAIIAGCGGTDEDRKSFATAWRRIQLGTTGRSSQGGAGLTTDPGQRRTRPERDMDSHG
jgi:hypothetical protein